jgi:hypothetical protein
MAFSLNLANIADAIAAISISGVTVKDKDQIAASWVSTPNVLYPNPDGWITDFRLEYKAIPRGSAAPVNVMYTLNYRFLGVQVGDMATMPVSYSDLVSKVIAIINAVVAVHAPYDGGVDLVVQSVDLGPMTDPAGNQYYGADLAFSVEEIQN